MSKIRRYLEPGASYFLTTVVKDREKIFIDNKICYWLLGTIGFYKVILDFNLYAFVFMPDHVHLLVQPLNNKYTISDFMRGVKGAFSAKYNRFKGRKGPLWQSRFYDEGIRTRRDFISKLNYIHNNPVSKGLVKDPGKYQFSSYVWYNGKIPNYLVDTDFDII